MRRTNDLDLALADDGNPAPRERLLRLQLEAARKRRPTTLRISARGNYDAPVPLSYAQERLWFLDQLGLIGAAYNRTLALRLSGQLDGGALEQCFAELVRRHEILRTRIQTHDGVPHQVIDPPGPSGLRREDLSHLAAPHQREEQLRECMRREQLHRFALSEGPLIRVVLVRQGRLEHALLITVHHIISDGWSVGVLMGELGTLYAAYVRGQPSPLPELAVQYADYAIWQRQWLQGEMLKSRLKYWSERLAGAPPQVELPTDRPRPAVESFKGAMLSFRVPERLTGVLGQMARREGATLFMVILAAYQLLLSRWSGQQDIVVGSPIAGRNNREVEGLIGSFVNTLALRTEVSGILTFRQLLDRVKEVTLGAYAHDDLPFERLVMALRPERSLARQPIAQAMLALQNYPEERLELPGVALTWISTECTSAHFDLTLYVHERSCGLSGEFEYATDLFDRETIERMARHFSTLLEWIIANPDRPIRELSLLNAAEKQQILVEWNATMAPYPRERSVPELFVEQVERTPHAPALTFERCTMSYAELNARANRLAHHLISLGVGPEVNVGVHLERSIEMAVGFLAILKAGGAYLPLDPSYPLERIAFMLDEAQVSVVLTNSYIAERLQDRVKHVIRTDRDDHFPRRPSSNPLQHIDPNRLAYVLYTSGSTGQPKAVGVTHRNIVRLLMGTDYIHVSERDVFLQLAPPAFDASTFEIWGALLNGAKLVLYPHRRLDLEALQQVLEREHVSVLWLTTGLFHRVIDERPQALASLKWLLTGGEVLSVSHVKRALKQLHGCRLINCYGPTEATTFSVCFPITDPDALGAAVPIGRPIANTQVYVLDKSMQPVPLGITGELYIGGDGVARGYLNKPELTAERFVANPFYPSGTRLYRTGDLVRWNSTGTLEFIGRTDDQVKIRGYRIELGEIEAKLLQHAQVQEAVVLAREDEPGEKRLVAYIKCLDQTGPSVDDLRAYLNTALPEYLVPSAFVILESLPLMPNGKLDRRALPAPKLRAYLTRPYEPPEGEPEETLARIWREFLQLDRAGRLDNFFELGGHSLLALKLLSTINQTFGSDLRALDLYQSPTIKELAERVGGSKPAEELVDLVQEGVLDGEIVARPGILRAPPNALLLTGSTGFVGRFLMAQLLQDTDATLYCLVRARSVQHALSRLKATLSKWDLWREEFENRIVPIPGDLSLPHLGINESHYTELSRNVASIYHCGIRMNHLETYSMSKAANVDGANELLKLATCHTPKLVNYISTLGVFSAFGADTTRTIDERSPIDHEKHLTTRGYTSSKWVAEKLFMMAGERGIPCNIFRLGLVWADTQQGRYDELQWGYRMIKTCLLSGYGIKNYRYDLAPTPVDYVAQAVVSLSKRHSNGAGIFHISSSKQMDNGFFERCNEIANTSLMLLSFYDWIREIKRLHEQGRTLPEVPLVEFAFSMNEASFNEHRRSNGGGSAGIRFHCDRTHRELEAAGIVAPTLNDDLIRQCLESMLLRDADFVGNVPIRLANQEGSEIECLPVTNA